MSAFGMLSSAQSFETVRARLQPLAGRTVEAVHAVLGTLAAEASQPLLAAGVPAGSIRIERRVDMRYMGQGHDLEVRLPDEADPKDVPALLTEKFAEGGRTPKEANPKREGGRE